MSDSRIGQIADEAHIGPLLRRRFYLYKEGRTLADGRVDGAALFWDNAEACNTDPKDLIVLSPEAEAEARYFYETVRISQWSPEAEPLRQAARQFNAAFNDLYDKVRAWRPHLRAARVIAAMSEAEIAALLPDRMKTPENLALLGELWQTAVTQAETLKQVEQEFFG